MTCLSKRCAFTLTEMAIVLGVSGTVLGAVWVTASTVRLNQKVGQTAYEIKYIIQKMQSLNAVNPNAFYSHVETGCTVTNVVCPTPPGTCVPGIKTSDGQYDYMYTYATSGIYPSEMVNGSIISTPWGKGDIAISVEEVTNSCGVNAGLVSSASSTLPPGQSVTIGPSTPGFKASTSFSYLNNGNIILTITDMSVKGCIQLMMSSVTDFLRMGMTQFCTGTCTEANIPNLTPASTGLFTLGNITQWCSAMPLDAAQPYLQIFFSLTPPAQ